MSELTLELELCSNFDVLIESEHKLETSFDLIQLTESEIVHEVSFDPVLLTEFEIELEAGLDLVSLSLNSSLTRLLIQCHCHKVGHFVINKSLTINYQFSLSCLYH